ncbi:MAG TPA: branched-chain amino acid ABC transporter permease [Thermoanaerobaculia bacterium]
MPGILPRKWWLRDIIYLALLIGIIVAAWWGIAYITVYMPAMQYYNRIIVMMGINIMLAVSLNIINGHAGQFSLGHAGFMAVGAYFAAYLTFYHFSKIVDRFPEAQQPLYENIFLVIAILAGGGVAALAGYIVGLPSLRLRGDYLAIVTLGFGEIIRVLILNIEPIGAARGFSGIPPWNNFFWVFFFCVLTIVISNRLVKSSVGRAFLAVREDQIAAEAMGVNTTRYKVKAFVLGSALAGMAGGLFAHYSPAYLNPTMFTFIKSFEVVAMVVLGGLGSISGSILAAIIITFLPEGLRVVKDLVPDNAPEMLKRDPRMVIYSITLIVLMLTRPQGLLGRRELWEFLPKRKDTIPKEGRDEGNADDKLDRDGGPPVT